MERKIINATDVAQLLNVSVQRVYELCRSDPSFPHIRIGERQYRFSIDALEKWVQGGGSKKGGVSDNEN